MVKNGELELRAEAIRRYVAYTTAKLMLEEATARIPSGPAYNAYKKSLKLVQIPTGGADVFAVYGEQPDATPVDASRDILVFRERNTGRRRDKGLEVLLQYQPWTADTLPYKPPDNQVETRTRRVSEREVELVRKRINEQKREWTEAFARARVKISQPGTDVAKEASTDLSYTALRLEYGLGGSRAVAHWRPALASVKERVAQLFTRDDILGKELIDPDAGEWKRWRSLSAEQVPATVQDSFDPFQTKITG